MVWGAQALGFWGFRVRVYVDAWVHGSSGPLRVSMLELNIVFSRVLVR